MSTRGLIFDIQKFSLHDGPGIRTTVFCKGCPLDCWWCHNPESQAAARELMVRGDLCTGCAACVGHCPAGAIRLVGGRAVTDPEVCRLCGRCLVSCPQNGRSLCGTEMSPADVVEEVLQDRVFYEQSGGGVTFSGGEAMAQIDFLAEALAGCRAAGVHTAVDTSGHVPWASFEGIIDHTDLFLYDLKIIDDAAHRACTGVSNRLILENLRRLSETARDIFIRIPVVPTVNDHPENIAETIAFLRTIRCRQVDLLPYHTLGRGKAARLGKSWRLAGVESPSREKMEELRAQFIAAGIPAVTGD